MPINWHIPKRDMERMAAVYRRAHSMRFGGDEPQYVYMDLVACHANGCPLDLVGLVNADTADFAHDVGGIIRHIDRNTGELGGGFLPRYAAAEAQHTPTPSASDDYPDYPCPHDPDGLHHVGCGCDHDDTAHPDEEGPDADT